MKSDHYVSCKEFLNETFEIVIPAIPPPLNFSHLHILFFSNPALIFISTPSLQFCQCAEFPVFPCHNLDLKEEYWDAFCPGGMKGFLYTIFHIISCNSPNFWIYPISPEFPLSMCILVISPLYFCHLPILFVPNPALIFISASSLQFCQPIEFPVSHPVT